MKEESCGKLRKAADYCRRKILQEYMGAQVFRYAVTPTCAV
jgi:hypothetical protein